MRKSMAGFFLILCCGALLAGGCAKKEMVKSDTPVPPTTVAQPPEKPAPPATPPAKETPMQEEVMKEQPIIEASVREEAVKASAAEIENMLQTVYFDFDSHLLSQASRDILDKNAETLLKKTSLQVRVEGNSDERGSDAYNLSLGEKRAKSAMDYLIKLGVPAERISIISYGKEKPVDPGHDEAAWSKNRRVDFVIVSK